MAYVVTKQSGVIPGYIRSFQVDTRTDIADLPIAPECKPGSDCLVIEDSSVWILNTSGTEWLELGGSI